MSKPQLLSGVRGLIQLFDPTSQSFKTLAFATDINVNVRVGVRQTYVTGRMNPGAIDTLSYDVDVTVGRVIPVNAPDAALNGTSVAANPGEATGIAVGLETVVAQMVSAQDITIACEDKVTGAYVGSVRGCRFAGRTLTMNAGDIATERYNFVGIYDSGYQAPGGSNENAPDEIGYGV